MTLHPSTMHACPALYDLAIFIGRFQPPHRGHLDMLGHAFQVAHRVVVVIGTAGQARTPKNPFTWQERRDMIDAALSPAQRERVHYLPMRDFYNEARWVEAVTQGVAQTWATLARADGTAATPRTALLAHFKDASSSYLTQFPHWQMEQLPRQHDIDATQIRDALFGTASPHTPPLQQLLHTHLHPSTCDWLAHWCEGADFVRLQQEWQMLRDYRASWASAPFPPVFVTVDALLQCQGQVLLIERGHAPGKGLLALPGGFLEQRDTLWQSCLRELAEETHLRLDDARWQAAFVQSRVFDHPDRSLRGRTITHVFQFNLGDQPLPPVQGGDDARHAHWIPVADIAHQSDRFFDDHFHILQTMLDLEADGGTPST